MNDPYFEWGMKLIQNELDTLRVEDLECTDLNKLKVCSVPETHFYKKKSGNYYTRNNLNYQNRIYYDSSPIKITKPFEINIIGDNSNIEIGDKGILYLKI